MPSSLETIVDTRRVIITVGAGGVGKTTTSAALGVAAAQRGKRVLCMTIDPAKRLAESLGIERMNTEAMEIDPKLFQRAGAPLTGSLTVMMVDTKRTFDELVIKYSSSPESAKRLLENKLYQYVSTSLAGTQEYMAMEKLIAVKNDPRYDVVFLDTPPTANALDFLDAPGRLVDALDSAAMKWFIDAFQSTGKLSLNILARSASVVLRAIGKITGGSFLQDVAQFITELNDLFGGFKERAARVQETLRGTDVAFVLVTSPAPMSIKEVLYFSDRLEQHHMPRGALVVNRYRVPPPFAAEAPIPISVSAAAVAMHKLTLDEDAPERLSRAHYDAVKLAALDAHHIRALETRLPADVPVVKVPELASDVHDVKLLSDLARTLLQGGI
ncbi:ArsA family ATPase [Pendulispora albinea]|uniref:arsenite-transporting ATPase n=1 Tax=Pendulispora albinea TaxID=2741071 RepID=A0ABZ2LJ72_9BACT